MSVFKEIQKADGSGTTTFYRLDQTYGTVETTSTGTSDTMIDYKDILNKPSINDVALVGNKTSSDLGLQPAGDYALASDVPTNVSELTNDSNYATQAYVIEQVAGAEHFHREIVDKLPETGKDNVLYLLKKSGKSGDFYDEYLWINTTYEYIGSTSTDLSDYYKKEETDTLLTYKVDKVADKGLSSNDYTTTEKNKLASLENYDDSNLWNAVNALHNYDDTEVRADISALNTQVEGINTEIENIDEELGYQITTIRLIKQGDTWVWENSKEDILTFTEAYSKLGNPNILLFLENIENDGKVYPSFYSAEDDHVKIFYVDKETQIHILEIGASATTDTILGEDVIYQSKVDSKESLPTDAVKGEIRLVGSDDDVYIYDGSKWVPMDKGTSIDLSNYLAKDNTVGYAPTGNYNPATKKYVDDKVDDIFVPTKVSQLTNDSNFIGKNTSDLTNYYVKTNTYTKAEVNALIAGSGTGTVATLNGTKTTTPTWYAPTTAGTSGQILKSNGSGEPSWVDGGSETGNYIEMVDSLPSNPTSSDVGKIVAYNGILYTPKYQAISMKFTWSPVYPMTQKISNLSAAGSINPDYFIAGMAMGGDDFDNVVVYYGKTCDIDEEPNTIDGIETRTLETTADKVTAIDSSSTDKQYPSAKAVYEKIKPTLYVDSEGYICLEEE